MRSGSLDRQIDLMARGGGQSATGAQSDAWTPFATGVFAEKTDIQNDAPRDRDQHVLVEVATFRIWFREDVFPGHSIRYPAGAGGRRYLITGRKELGRREGLLLTAETELRGVS